MALKRNDMVGVVPPLMTPLLEDESLDEEGLANLVHYNLDNGVHGLFALGTTSEGVMVSRKVWKRATEIILREANDKVPVYCCAIDFSTSRVIESIKELEQLGAKTVCTTPHFYMVHFDQSEILRHYEKICRETNMQVMVYGNTVSTGINLQTNTMEQIAKIDNIVAFKDTRQDWGTHLHNLIELDKYGISIFGGGEEFLTASLVSGSHGNIAGLTNLFPQLFVDVYEAVKRGDIAKAYELQKRVIEIKKDVGDPTWLSGMKYLAAKRKLFKTETISTPMGRLTDADRRRLDVLLEKYW